MITENKKLRSFVLSTAFALLIAASLSPFLTPDRAFAQDEGRFGDDVSPVEHSGEYRLSDDGKIFEAYYGKAESFTIPDGVETIGSHAFNNCVTLKTIVIPNGVKEIGLFAFENCSNLATIAIPESVVFMRGAPFKRCRSLKSIDVAEKHSKYRSIEGVLFSKDGELLFKYPEGIEREKYVVPDGVRVLCEDAFANNVSLTEIVLPESLQSVSGGAFEYCASLKSLRIPDGVTAVHREAFSGCCALESIDMPQSVTLIGSRAFWGCGSLSEIVLPASLQTLGKESFGCCVSLKSIRIPESVVELGVPVPQLPGEKIGDVFPACSSLVSIDVEEGNTSFKSVDGVLFSKDGKTLIRCPEAKVADVYAVPESVATIEDGAFSNCQTIKEIVVSDNVKSVGTGAFWNCVGLRSLTLPKDLERTPDKPETFTHIDQLLSILRGTDELASINVAEGDGVFSSKDGVLFSNDGSVLVKYPNKKDCENYVVPDSVRSIESGAFGGCSGLRTISIHKDVVNIGKSAFSGCSRLTEIEVAEDNPQYRSIDGVLFKTDGVGNPTVLIKYPSGMSTESYAVPDGVKEIDASAFLWSSSLKSATIPESVEKIGYGAFLECGALESIEVAEGNPQYRSIDGVLFSKNRERFSIYETALLQYPTGSTVENYVVPKGFNEIGAFAFRGAAALKSIKLSEDVVYYGMDAFRNCVALESFDVDENNPQFKSIDGILFSKNGTVLYKCPTNKKLGYYEIPKGVVKIGDRAFVDCVGLTSIKIPDGVKELGNEAFGGCSDVKTIEIPASVVRLSPNALPIGQNLTIRAPKGSYAADLVVRNSKRLDLYFEPIE